MITDETFDGNQAVFSHDRAHRYQLRRVLARPAIGEMNKTVVFVMLNPSTADAFGNDPTISRCIKFARAWGAHVLEAVNLFSLKTPYPEDLIAADADRRGADEANDTAILEATQRGDIVVAAWGTNGALADRGDTVRTMLGGASLRLHHLGLSKDGYPKHPHARGVHRIPDDQQPIWWSR